MKKVISILLAAVMSLGILAACGNGGETDTTTAAPDDTTAQGEETGDAGGEEFADSVTFWTLNTRQAAFDPLAEQYEEETGRKIQLSYYDVDGIKDAKKIAASSDTLPNMWFNWGGSLGGYYANSGKTYNLNDYAEANGWSDIFAESALSLCTYDGKLAGFPTSYNVLGVYYRTDIFDEYGLEIPETFEEFEAVCATLKENGITPISTVGLYGWHVMRFVELLFEHYAGTELHDQMNLFEESWDNPAVVEALAKYQEFANLGYFPEGFVTMNPNDVSIAFHSGQAAMEIEGQWFDGNINDAEQNMENYGVFPFPSGGTNRMSSFAEMTQFNANLTDAELNTCIDFMKFAYNEDNIKGLESYYNLPLPYQGASMPEGQPNVPVMYDLAAENGTFTITDQAFPTEIADALFSVQDALATNQITPEEGAKQIQQAIDNYEG